MMRRLPVILLVSLVATIALAQSRSAAPKLLVEKLTYDLGNVMMGDVKKIRVRIMNAGGDTLRILQVVPSCGCTTAKMPKVALAGGESDIVELDFNSQGFRGKTTKHVTLVTNDPVSPSTVVNFEATVVSIIELVPPGPLAFFGNLPMGIASSRVIKIRNAWKEPVTISSISTAVPGVEIAPTQKTLRPNDTLTVSVRITPPKEGYSDGDLIVKTTYKKIPEVRFRLGFNGTTQRPM